jgi:osmoprotectant transport system ATP-binding protein
VGKWQGRPEVELVERMAELAEMAHLPIELLGKRPGELSGGQRQRVALMRALFLDPDVLLLDEPLGALDPMIRADLQRDLRAVFRDVGKTVVLVTHDMGEAAFFADEIVLLRAGRVVQWGAFRELVEAPVEPWVRDFIEAQRSPLDADA